MVLYAFTQIQELNVVDFFFSLWWFFLFSLLCAGSLYIMHRLVREDCLWTLPVIAAVMAIISGMGAIVTGICVVHSAFKVVRYMYSPEAETYNAIVTWITNLFCKK